MLSVMLPSRSVLHIEHMWCEKWLFCFTTHDHHKLTSSNHNKHPHTPPPPPPAPHPRRQTCNRLPLCCVHRILQPCPADFSSDGLVLGRLPYVPPGCELLPWSPGGHIPRSVPAPLLIPTACQHSWRYSTNTTRSRSGSSGQDIGEQ